MRLLFTYFLPSGGIETLNRLRCRALAQAGIEAHLLYLRDGAGKQNISGIPYFITDSDADIGAIIQAGNYDAIIACCDHLMLPRLRALGYTGKLLYEAQGLGELDQAKDTIEWAAPYIRLYAQGILSPITAHLMELFNLYLPDVHRFYLHNMVDTQTFNYRASSWLNPANQPILAWIGRLEPNKNWSLFLHIAAMVAQHKPDLTLWMFEDANITTPGERERFTEMLAALQLQHRVVLRSNVPHSEMPYYMSAVGDSGGMLVSTSNVEGFGYAVAEAMSCCCPVLTTDSDGVRVFINHNQTGKYFYGRSAEAGMYEALDLMNNRQLAEQIRHNALAHIQTHFSETKYIADMINILGTLGLYR
ncbi:glycosyltransferase involved in cell wall biosynthesis [Paenibacillus phyllosphaerae]|uniref:Glycosyltransferase involved in cell wall biosynthesis n=1 Tax=Paenibacillus phyllosphaerae TaxID=274593 RepID=A0A7W5B3Q4_9BACL|nr:glycosyltransferase family 4 protein [Paenibacillus phyllosphaerae]MBB3113619.1 glycosyltransferase involved in cell wall biosynthesis [Paenibacillus phyllosphaerae]